MKYFAYLALVGAASAYSLADMEDASQELLTIRMNDWAGRRINRKAEDMGNAWEAMMFPRNRDRRADWRHTRQDIEYLLGEDLDMYMERVQPESRYLPKVNGWWESGKMQHVWDLQRAIMEKDHKFGKIRHQAEKLNMDLFGGCGRRGCNRGLLDNADSTYERPPQKVPGKHYSRNWTDKNEWETHHWDNSDIKDVFEDGQDLVEDYADFVSDFDYEPFEEIVKYDYQQRNHPDALALRKMISEDQGFENSYEGWGRQIEQFAERFIERLDTWAEVEFFTKSVERFIRVVGKNVEITDLPTGERMDWVNDFFEELVQMLKSDTSAERIEEWIGEELDTICGMMVQNVEDWIAKEDKEWGEDDE